MEGQGILPGDPELAEQIVSSEVRGRVRRSGRTNISRAVSDLVRAGFLRRHYQGYRVDHENRGGREAVYTILPTVRRALGKG
jgi:predicted transcriptional regulator